MADDEQPDIVVQTEEVQEPRVETERVEVGGGKCDEATTKQGQSAAGIPALYRDCEHL